MPEADGSTRLDPDRAADALYADCPEHLAAWAIGLLRPQSAGCGRGIPERQSWQNTAFTYVTCAADRAIDPALQRAMATRCAAAREWPTGHSPFVGRPGLVIDLLNELLNG